MKFLLHDPSFLLNRAKFPAGEGRYRWHPDFPALRIDIKPLNGDFRPVPLVIMPRPNVGKSDGARYLIGVDLRLFPPIRGDILPQKRIGFDIYKAKVPHSFEAISAYHFPHSRFENVWLEVKIE